MPSSYDMLRLRFFFKIFAEIRRTTSMSHIVERTGTLVKLRSTRCENFSLLPYDAYQSPKHQKTITPNSGNSLFLIFLENWQRQFQVHQRTTRLLLSLFREIREASFRYTKNLAVKTKSLLWTISGVGSTLTARHLIGWKPSCQSSRLVLQKTNAQWQNLYST